MLNLRMKAGLESGDCLDVAEIGTYDTKTDTYVIDTFDEDLDYAEKRTERWIWSIGKRASDGSILAAFDARFYQNPGFTCLWLR